MLNLHSHMTSAKVKNIVAFKVERRKWLDFHTTYAPMPWKRKYVTLCIKYYMHKLFILEHLILCGYTKTKRNCFRAKSRYSLCIIDTIIGAVEWKSRRQWKLSNIIVKRELNLRYTLSVSETQQWEQSMENDLLSIMNITAIKLVLHPLQKFIFLIRIKYSSTNH